jgi:hypothetical protein
MAVAPGIVQKIKRAKTLPSVATEAADWFHSFLLADYIQLAQQVNAVQSVFQQFQITTVGAQAVQAVTFTFPYPDTLYALAAMADWNTTIWFTAKAKGGVTLNFGTASPGNNNVTLITCR